MLPGIVLVIGIMLFWNQIYHVLPLYNTMGIMVLAYVVLFLAVHRAICHILVYTDKRQPDCCGRVFGGKPLYILRHITLYFISPGIATGWMMTFIIAFRELVTASLIAPPNTLVVSTYIMREFEQGSVSVGMAMAVLCVLFTTTALLALNAAIDRSSKGDKPWNCILPEALENTVATAFSCKNGGDAILVDCGLMAGSDDPLPRLTESQIRKLKAVFLTHSHADHTGALPWLLRQGYTGPIISTTPTLQQLPFIVQKCSGVGAGSLAMKNVMA